MSLAINASMVIGTAGQWMKMTQLACGICVRNLLMQPKMKIIKIKIEIPLDDRDGMRDVIVDLKRLVKLLMKRWKKMEV